MSKQTRIGVVMVFLLFYTGLARAWDSVGHMVIAQIAYHQLKPNTKQEVQQLLEVLQPFYPRVTHLTSAAAWPDWIKGEGVTAYNSWHYIDQPYSRQVMAPEPEHENVVWAIEQALAILANQRANRLHKAMFLRFLAHFTADVHQPMHCISLYNERFPKGDKGGNAYVIKYGKAKNLHALWDRGVDLFRNRRGKALNSRQRQRLVSEIEQAYPLESFAKQMREHATTASWAKESYQLAVDYAYSLPEHSRPNAEYIKSRQAIVKRQVALAGYRLAAQLNRLFS